MTPRSPRHRPRPTPATGAGSASPTGTDAGAALPSLSDRLQRGELMSADCPSRDVLKHVTSRWGVLLLVTLLGGVHRFSDLRRKIGGVSEKMLAQTLKWLEADGFVLRHSYATVPPHVEYTLTPLGRQVGKRVAALADWIEVTLPDILDARQALGTHAQASRADTIAAQRLAPTRRGSPPPPTRTGPLE